MTVGSAYPLAPGFLWERRTSRTIVPFPVAASLNGACGFPALRFPGDFAPRVMMTIRLGVLSGLGPSHAIVGVDAERVVQLVPTPPFPAEALAFLAGLVGFRLGVHPLPHRHHADAHAHDDHAGRRYSVHRLLPHPHRLEGVGREAVRTCL